MLNQVKCVFIISILVIKSQVLLAQKNQIGVEIRCNKPVGLASIPAAMSRPVIGSAADPLNADQYQADPELAEALPLSYGMGLMYGLTNDIAVGFNYNKGTIAGAQRVENPTKLNIPSNYKAYTNTFTTYEFTLEVDVVKLLSPSKTPALISTRIKGGFGYVTSDIKTLRADNRVRDFHYTCYGNMLGTVVQVNLSPQVKANVGVNLIFTETYYLDGIHKDFKNDRLLMPYAGLSTWF